MFPNFQNCARCSLYLKRKYALIFVLGHYLFLEARSSPRVMLLENCSLLGTDSSEFTNREKTGRRGLEFLLRMRVPLSAGVVTTSRRAIRPF